MPDDPSRTPKLDELEKGPWPSFVRELKRAAGGNAMSEQLLGVLELSYEDRVGHWKHGGVVGVRGYGAGVIGRYSDVPEQFPEVAQFHTMRVNHPAGWFYTTDALRTICDIWEKHGSGLTNLHGATGDIILLGTKTESLEPAFADLTANGFDLGGSGSVVRTPSCCVGPARCEWACFDTLALTYDITQHYQDETAPPVAALQVQDQGVGLPERLRGRHRPGRPQHHRHVARPDRRRAGGRSRAYAEGGLDIARQRRRSVPVEVHGVGRASASRSTTAPAPSACTAST